MIPVTGTSVDIGVNANLELVDKFCYLDDMLSVDGDADTAMENRIQIGWNKFRQLVPLLTNMDISLCAKQHVAWKWDLARNKGKQESPLANAK